MPKTVFSFCNLILILVTSVFGSACENSINKYFDSIYTKELYSQSGYHLNSPDSILYLPSYLNEISGLSLVDNSHLAAIQDESGKIFIISLENGIVEHQVLFGRNADFEGIEYIDGDVFVIKSNGDLYRFKYDPYKDEADTEKIKTPLKSRNDVEGLAYDHESHRLLIACKGKGDIGENEVKGKSVYSIDTRTMEFLQKPTYNYKKKDISEIIKIKYPDMKLSDNVDPSGIAIHPVTGKIYIIAHVGKALVILNRKGEVEEFYPLNPSLFQQPEGICFNSSGDMFISNEVGHNRPNILKFSYQNDE